jgi:hypothetical protein
MLRGRMIAIKQTELPMSKASKQVVLHEIESPLNLKFITIGGDQYLVPSPYAAGHVCTEGEANALNQTMQENVRNNLTGKAKDGKLTQEMVDQYVANYAFGNRTGFTADPIASMALAIARKKVNKKGLNASEVTAAAHALLASDKGAAIRKAAAAMVEA